MAFPVLVRSADVDKHRVVKEGLGELGEGAYLTSALLLRRGLVSVIASDAHHFYHRNPHMGALLEALDRRFPEVDAERLLRTVPMKIAKDQSL